MKLLIPIFSVVAAVLVAFFVMTTPDQTEADIESEQVSAVTDTIPNNYPYSKTEAEWKQLLTPEQYEILRLKGTEKPFDNKYEHHKAAGVYVCAACGQPLFSSTTKYDSFCGWPSFWDAIDTTAITTHEDLRYGFIRTEIICSNCGGHLGHVFDDGPPPTGLRYCMNSVAMNFIPSDSIEALGKQLGN